MKRILSLLLAALMLTGILASCGKTSEDDTQEEDKGAEVTVYIGSEIRNWDPALTYTQSSAVKFFSLVYEGLTRINAEGKMEYALAKNVKIIEDEEKQEYKMQIQLVDTAWSDGRQLSADDVIYAWKRILEPSFQSSACALLFNIKNARAVRNGDATIDDLGLEALDTTLLQITFEGKIDYDQFLENCASPALVPLREDVAGRYSDLSSADYWGKKAATTLSSGPFTVKNMDTDSAGKTLTLQRNDYYHALDGNKEGKVDKYVTPYRLNMNFGYDAEGRTTAYSYDYTTGKVTVGSYTLSEAASQIQYLADVSTDTADVHTQDLLSTYSFYINTSNSVLSNAKVREALSVSLDRTKIASMLGTAKPATGLVPYGVYYTTLGGDLYRDKVGDVLSASANLDSAKKLLSDAGVKSGSFTLTYYKGSTGSADIAAYCKEVWEGLGFTVNLDEKGINQYSKMFIADSETGEYGFDMIAMDYQTLSTSAFSVLAPFATGFSGMAKNTNANDFSDVPSMSGYISADYDALIEAAFSASTRDDMATQLAAAEKLLMQDAPIIPLAFRVDTYIYNTKVLSNIGSNAFGGRVFTKTKMKNYDQYTPAETTAAEDTGADAAAADTTAAQ